MMELYLAVFFGAAINLAIGLNEAIPKPDFKWLTFLKQNGLPFVLNLLLGSFLIWAKDDLKTFAPFLAIEGKLMAGLVGFSGQTLFKKIQKAFDKKVDTVLGANS